VEKLVWTSWRADRWQLSIWIAMRMLDF